MGGKELVIVTESTVVSAVPREVIGKASRRLAKDGLIPAVLYGPKRETIPLSLGRLEFERFLHSHAGAPGLVELNIAGIGKPVNAMVKQIQRATRKDAIVHVDLLAIRLDRPVQATVTLHFVGEAPGVKEGGIMLHDIREIMVEALPADLPDFIDVDMSGMTADATMTVGDIVVPRGVRVVDDPSGVICSISARSATVEVEVSSEAAEPEVVGSETGESVRG